MLFDIGVPPAARAAPATEVEIDDVALVRPDGFFRTFPDAASMDGFFAARIVKG